MTPVTLFALALTVLATPATLALAQQPGAPQYGGPSIPPQQPCPPSGYPGVPPQPGCTPGAISAPAMPAQPYGAPPPMSGNPQPYGGGMPGAPMPGSTWSWPPQGSAWPVQPGAQEIVAPDAGQSQPLTPGVPTQTHVPSFVIKPTPPPPRPPAQSDFPSPPPQ